MTDKQDERAAEKAEEKAAAEEAKADEKTAAEEKKATTQGKADWFHDVDHDTNAARHNAQRARDEAAGAPADPEDSQTKKVHRAVEGDGDKA